MGTIEAGPRPDRLNACFYLVRGGMMLMALMLFVFVVFYLLMLGLVNFAEGVIDKGLSGKLPSTNPLETNPKPRSL